MIKVFDAKFPAIAHMHTTFGTPLQSQWKFPTLFADKIVWMPDSEERSHFDPASKRFTFTGDYPDACENHDIWHLIKDSTLINDAPTTDEVTKAAHTHKLPAGYNITPEKERLIPIIATWLSRVNPNGYKQYLAYYPANELSDILRVWSAVYLGESHHYPEGLILAVAASLGFNLHFTTGPHPQPRIRSAVSATGALMLPQKLPPTCIDYTQTYRYRFRDRFKPRRTDGRGKAKNSSERQRYKPVKVPFSELRKRVDAEN